MKKINWPNLIAEFIVVLLGILLAFQLNTCSAESQQKDTIQTHISALKEETAFNKTNLQTAIDLLSINENKLDSLMTYISTDGDLEKINTLSMELLNVGGAYSKSIAYKTLIESGDVRFLKDVTFKSETVNLYEYYEWVKSTDKIALESFNEQYFRYIKENFDLLNEEPQPREVFSTKEYLNSLASYRYFIDMRRLRYEGCMLVIEKYIKRLNDKEVD